MTATARWWCLVMYLCHVSSCSCPLFACSVFQAVAYVDAQRNMAVTMGERDVKSDVKEKSRQEYNINIRKMPLLKVLFLRRDKYKAFMERCVEGDTAESYIVQARWGPWEAAEDHKKLLPGSGGDQERLQHRRSSALPGQGSRGLRWRDRSQRQKRVASCFVKLVASEACLHLPPKKVFLSFWRVWGLHQGRPGSAPSEPRLPGGHTQPRQGSLLLGEVRVRSGSLLPRLEAGVECSELSHHLYFRIKRSAFTEEWIGRCEETIKLFFEAVNLDLSLVTEMLGGGNCSKYF